MPMLLSPLTIFSGTSLGMAGSRKACAFAYHSVDSTTPHNGPNGDNYVQSCDAWC